MKNIVFLLVLTFQYFLMIDVTAQSSDNSKLIGITGGFGVGTQYYKAFGIDNRNLGSLWNLHGNATLTVAGKFSLPFTFTIGQHKAKGSYPTFKQLGFSPEYKWMKVHLGWRNLKFSDFTLSQRTFFGVGVELNPGIFRFAALKGRLNKARDYESGVENLSTHIFKRNFHSIKLGVGNDKSYVDLIYLKAEDVPNSIIEFRNDSIPKPAENVVMGLNTKVTFGAALNLYAEVAASIFTRDVNSLTTDEEFPGFLTRSIMPKESTRANYAMKSGVEIKGSKWRTTLQYERISPEFNSMGAYYLREDIERLTISPNFSLFRNKLRFNGSVGIQRNNLLNVKSETTKNLLLRGNTTYQANDKFGINLNFNSFNLRQENGHSVLNDTIRIAQVNSNYSISPYWVWIKDSTSVETMNISLNHQKLNDKNQFTRKFSDMTTWFINALFSKNFNRTNLGWNIGANYNIIELPSFVTQRYGVSLGLNKSTTDNKWSFSASTSFNLSSIEGESDGNIISNDFSIQFTPKRNHSFSFNANILRNNSKQFESYTELLMNTSYQYSFK